MVKESINGIKLVNAFYVVNNDILNHTVLKIKKVINQLKIYSYI